MPTLDFSEKVEQIKEAIRNSEMISEQNKEHLLTWIRDLRLSNLKDATVQKRASLMKVVAEHLEHRNFGDIDKDGMKDLIEWVQSRDVADSTIEGYKKVIRFYWRWLWEHEGREWDDRADYPPIVD